MARLVPRAYAHLRNYMDDQHVNGEGRTFSSRHGRLVRAICRGTDGLNPGHRSPLSGACLCQLQYRYEMCVRPSTTAGVYEAIGGFTAARERIRCVADVAGTMRTNTKRPETALSD